MKKSTKLLSVLLAVVMLFSCMSVLASAARTEYKTVDDLDAIGAYNNYGSVTRLSTEARLSILFDYVDNMLGSLGGEPLDISIATIDYSSVDALLASIDELKNSVVGTLVGNNPDGNSLINRIGLDSWDEGMSRDGTDHTKIVAEIVELLYANRGAVEWILDEGEINLGALQTIIGGFVDLDSVLAPINAYLADVPSLLKGLIYPLLERKDDDMAQINALANPGKDDTLDNTLTTFVQNLFTKPQSTTTVKADAEGNLTSDHQLPSGEGTRYYYVKGTSNGQPSYTAYVYNTATGSYTAEDPFVLKEEVEGSGVYVYAKATGETLKYYEPGSYWLKSLEDSGEAANIMNISAQNGVQMLYDMIPYVFGEMAPVVLNGSVKKLVAEWFGTKFTYVGELGDEKVTALGSNAFFTQEQGDYLWEWSDYAVIDGTHYYRFEDSFYVGDTSGANKCMGMVNWDYKIPEGLLDKYIPNGADGSALSDAGYNTILKGLNDFFGEVIGMVLSNDVAAQIGWTDGDNANLLENVKKAARVIVGYAPETIFGEDYENDAYYQLMMNEGSTDQEILCGIAAKLLEALMPQLILPSAESLKGQSLGAMLAMVIRELATQLIPTYNYDDLIFTDYDTKTLRKEDNSYWLDVCLTMGVDIGMSYLRNLADLGDDVDGVGYATIFTQTEYAYEGFDRTGWEDKVDWVIDWALSTEYEWTWKMERFVDCGADVSLTTNEDPWVKLGNILKNILPINQILNVDTSADNWLETTLRTNFVEALLKLDLPTLVGSASKDGILMIPTTSILRSQALLPSVVNVVRDLLNNLLYKVAGDNLIDPGMVNGQIEQLFRSSTGATQDNLADLARRLLERLNTAANNGLLDPVMPILGFFVGWTTDAQKFADPTLTVDTAGYGYIYTTGSTANATLKVTNNSSGMLLRHRNSDVTDQDYILVIDGVSGDFTSSATFPISVNPYASADVALTANYAGGDQGVAVTVYYHYQLKDGTMLSENLLQATTYQMISNRQQSAFNGTYDSGFESSEVLYKVRIEGDGGPVDPLVTDRNALASTVSGITINWVAKNEDRPGRMTASEYRAYDSNYLEDTGAAAGYLNYNMTYDVPIAVSPARLKVDAETIPSGTVIDLGEVYANLYWRNSSWPNQERNAYLTANLGNLYFADLGELNDLFDAEIAAARKAQQYTGETWAVYDQAMKATAAFVLAPVSWDNFSTTYSDEKIASVVENLENAVEQLDPVETFSITPASVLQPVLDELEGEGEVNYQDYELYEYWDYEEQRTAARNLIAGTTEPAAPEKYIDGCALTGSALDELVAAETNAKKAEAIKATIQEPDMEAYAQTLAAWTPAAYTELEVLDMANKLEYYHQFLAPNAKTAEKQFLDKEIEAAAAQGYVETEYSADSWAAYQAALAYANEVSADPAALQSEVFNAKYDLMITQNRLFAKADSAKDNGGYDNLYALIETAESIFADETGSWTVKAGVEEAKAYKQLIEALGYEYEDGAQNLYWDSATAFVATDRDKDDPSITAMADKLQAAIDNFESAAKPELLPSEAGETSGVVIDRVSYCADGNGFIYGIDVYNMYGPEEIAAQLATPAGSIRITANDMGTYSTGAKIELLNETGEVVETYYYVYFGDVNGDGYSDVGDISTVDGVVSWLLYDFAENDGSPAAVAADVNGDGYIDVGDVSTIDGIVSWQIITTQPEIAATVAAAKGVTA